MAAEVMLIQLQFLQQIFFSGVVRAPRAVPTSVLARPLRSAPPTIADGTG
jgi:hypothetical protein